MSTRPTSQTSGPPVPAGPALLAVCCRARSRARSSPCVEVRATSRTGPAAGHRRSASWPPAASRPARSRQLTPAPPCAASNATPPKLTGPRPLTRSIRRRSAPDAGQASGPIPAAAGPVAGGQDSPRLVAIRSSNPNEPGPAVTAAVAASSARPVSGRITGPAAAPPRTTPTPGSTLGSAAGGSREWPTSACEVGRGATVPVWGGPQRGHRHGLADSDGPNPPVPPPRLGATPGASPYTRGRCGPGLGCDRRSGSAARQLCRMRLRS
jgi:hypothetical protein